MQPRSNAPAYLLHSREFLAAAELVLNHANGVSLPAYFLLARSIELSLKTYLLISGRELRTLASKKVGHNLDVLHALAMASNLDAYAPLTAAEAGALRLLSSEYSATRLGYRVAGATYHLPMIEVTEDIARRLVATLEGFPTADGEILLPPTENV